MPSPKRVFIAQLTRLREAARTAGYMWVRGNQLSIPTNFGSHTRAPVFRAQRGSASRCWQLSILTNPDKDPDKP